MGTSFIVVWLKHSGLQCFRAFTFNDERAAEAVFNAWSKEAGLHLFDLGGLAEGKKLVVSGGDDTIHATAEG